jgi:serine/threonine protein kinase
MDSTPTLDDLVKRWQQLRQQGQTPSLEELCAGSAEQAEHLRKRLEAVAAMESFLGIASGAAGSREGRLDTPADGSAGRPQPVTVTLEAPLPSLPGYEVLGKLGEGGMGVVFRARDQALKRLVAVKQLLHPAPSAEGLARFRAEAEALARLRHPHVVQVHAAGEQDGRPYFVMEYVEGGGLDRKLNGRPQPLADAARLVMLLARAVHAAHQQGIVHRDLKPANILVAPPADEPALNTAYGLPKVSDFGLSKAVGEDQGLTAGGTILGTPGYMAPEQADGRPEDVGPATDVYALGAILYELLTGQVPFRGRGLLETLEQVRTQPPRPPHELRPDVPAELEAVCLRCLAKAPADRYPSAQALADDLHRFAEGHAVSRPPAPQRTTRPGRRVGWLVAALAVLAGVVALTVALRGPRGGEGGAPVIRQPPAREPFQGWIDVVMSRPNDARRQLLRLHDPAARPLKAGDEVRVETSLNRPAYQYIVWIDTQGKAAPVYPWIEGEWARRPKHEEAVKELHLPEGGLMWPMQPGPAGMETLVLLVREEPLPPDVDLAALLAGLGAQTTSDLQAVGWFQNGELVTREKDRAPSFKQVRASDNPVLRTQQVVQERVKGHFAYTRAVTFGNEGGR